MAAFSAVITAVLAAEEAGISVVMAVASIGTVMMSRRLHILMIRLLMSFTRLFVGLFFQTACILLSRRL